MKKIIDPLSFNALLFVIGMSIAIYGGRFANNKNVLVSGVVLIVLAAVYLAYLTKYGTATVVENKYDKTIKYKPENGTVDTLQPKQKLSGIDGIRKPVFKDKPIRKFRNGVNVKIDTSGNAEAVNLISKWLGQSDHAPASLGSSWAELEKQS